VLQPGRDLDLAEEPIGSYGCRELWPKDLDGNFALVPDVIGQVNSGHATFANEALDGIALSERGAQQFERIGHERASEAWTKQLQG
jgi:hypothetical protein